jgi:microcystin-dependent protein
MPFFGWSQTAGSNATADPAINWAEGQAPSSVNDSARAMMAALAKYRDDIAGAIVTGGTSTAYTVASYEGYDTLAHLNGMMIAFTPHTSSGASPPNGVTLNVDGLGAKPLRISPNVELVDGALIQGTPYVAVYNNSDGAFYLRGFSGAPYQIPVGGLMPYLGTTAPNSAFALPFGQAISRTTYASLFSLIGTTFGSGDGSTTFNIIDLRGRLPIGQDNMGGSAANRVTTAGSSIDGTTVGAAGGAQNTTLSQAQLPNVNFTCSLSANISALTVKYSALTTFSGYQSGGGLGAVTGYSGTFNQSATVGGSIAVTGTAGSGGSGTAVVTMPPGIVVPYILRVI